MILFISRVREVWNGQDFCSSRDSWWLWLLIWCKRKSFYRKWSSVEENNLNLFKHNSFPIVRTRFPTTVSGLLFTELPLTKRELQRQRLKRYFSRLGFHLLHGYGYFRGPSKEKELTCSPGLVHDWIKGFYYEKEKKTYRGISYVWTKTPSLLGFVGIFSRRKKKG